MSLSRSTRASIRAIGAMVLAAVLLWLGWTAWALSADTAQQRWVAPIELTPELGAWRMAAGIGEFTEEGLRITRPATMGNVVVAIELRDRLDTGRFYRVEIQAVERLPDYLALGWSTRRLFARLAPRRLNAWMRPPGLPCWRVTGSGGTTSISCRWSIPVWLAGPGRCAP